MSAHSQQPRYNGHRGISRSDRTGRRVPRLVGTEARWFLLYAPSHQSHAAGECEEDMIDTRVAGDLHVEPS